MPNFKEHLRKKIKFWKCEKLFGVQETKIMDLSNDLVDRTQNLKVTSIFAVEKDKLAKEAEERACVAEKRAR